MCIVHYVQSAHLCIVQYVRSAHLCHNTMTLCTSASTSIGFSTNTSASVRLLNQVYVVNVLQRNMSVNNIR